jgi:A/G-specific adenine glycosylase
VRCNGQTAIHRRGEGDIWQGLWEPWAPADMQDCDQPDECEAKVVSQFAKLGKLRLLKRSVKHILTHRVLLADFYLLECDERPSLPADYIWIPEADIDQYGVPRLVELLLEEVAK